LPGLKNLPLLLDVEGGFFFARAGMERRYIDDIGRQILIHAEKLREYVYEQKA
jgi:hypothetical protein